MGTRWPCYLKGSVAPSSLSHRVFCPICFSPALHCIRLHSYCQHARSELWFNLVLSLFPLLFAIMPVISRIVSMVLRVAEIFFGAVRTVVSYVRIHKETN